MNIEKYAPIAIPVFDRPHHFKRCIESLKKNLGAEKTVLYVSSDGPRCNKSKILVQQVRDYIKTIHGFKKVTSFMPNENTSKNIWFETRQRVSDDNQRFIVTEDDNVFSPYFLEFINNGLEVFLDEPKVAAICGYNYPDFPFQKPEAIALRCFAGWGYGTWREKDLLSRVDMRAVASEVFADKQLFAAINKALPHMAPMMQSIFVGNLIAGDVTACSLLIKQGKVCIFPSKSLVTNMGHDGSGEHCGVSDIYSRQTILRERISVRDLLSLEPSEMHTRWLSNFFGGRWSEMKNWMVFWEMNLKSPVLKKILRSASSFLGLPRRASGFLYRSMKRNFT